MEALSVFGIGDTGSELIIIAMLPIGMLLLFFGLFTGDGRARLLKRVERIKAHHDHRHSDDPQVSIARRTKKSSEIEFLDQLIRRLMPRQDVLRLRLERAGLGISIGVYVLASLLISAVAGFCAAELWHAPPVVAILFGVSLGLFLPHSYVNFRIKSRQNKFIDLFPDAIDLMVRGLKAGLPVGESVRTAGDEMPDPVGTELKRITDGVRIGRQMDEVLWEASKRLNLQEFDFFTIAISIQSETGGNLAETLNNLAEVLRGRRQLKRKIRALSSEAKASAYIIGSLPFVMTLLIYLVNSEYITGLFNDPRGQAMLAFGLFMVVAGAAVMFKMVKFEI